MRNGVHRNRTKASSHIAAANTGMRMMTLTDRVVTSGLQTTKVVHARPNLSVVAYGKVLEAVVAGVERRICQNVDSRRCSWL